MPLSFTCPHCDYTSLVDDRYVGQSGPCAACGKVVTVERPAPSSLSSPRAKTQTSGSVGRKLLVALASIVAMVLLSGVMIGLVYLTITMSDVVRTGTLNNACAENLLAIGKAMLQYHNEHGRFPPAATLDPQGRPMHSWRVLLLPYLGHEALFHQYDMSVPWNYPQNQLLAAQMPAVYHCPDSLNVASSETSYMVVVAPGGVFHGAESASLLEIADGPAQTLLVVETTGMAINWLEPRDLQRDSISLSINGAFTGGIGSSHPSGEAHALMADGTVKHLSGLTSADTIEAMLTIDGADVVTE